MVRKEALQRLLREGKRTADVRFQRFLKLLASFLQKGLL